MGFPATPVLDNFNRANEGPPLSARWVNSFGTGLKVLTNVAVADARTADQAGTWNTSYPSDQEVFFNIATSVPADGSTGTGPLARLVTSTDYNSDHYEVGAIAVAGTANDVLRMFKEIATVFTQLGADFALGVDFAVGDQVGFSVIGGTLTAYYKGVSQGTRTDTAIPGAGFIGLFYNANTNSDLDSFGGGAVFRASPAHVGSLAGWW